MPEIITIKREYVFKDLPGNAGKRDVHIIYDSLSGRTNIEIERMPLAHEIPVAFKMRFDDFDKFVDDLVAFRDMAWEVSRNESRIRDAVNGLRKPESAKPTIAKTG